LTTKGFYDKGFLGFVLCKQDGDKGVEQLGRITSSMSLEVELLKEFSRSGEISELD